VLLVEAGRRELGPVQEGLVTDLDLQWHHADVIGLVVVEA
jgi:hypothetical protein